ncbi:MAG TPA: hemerythrin domain-containing protein [Tahibacter sp.]|uniref:hemerythrin domain-containing protein n=1 Tax=Tahibacter sp. TaxID=2056211 RepID=UPI002C0C5826|nr:hemerythrin domain-containing protein [Tahibacter sp.]HSX60618.1 hemerythrin domain-containing protein [Tahibacter sp.]
MASRKPATIIDLLKADHREVERLFAEFDEAEGNPKQQAALASRIGQALTIHAEIEETLFYPVVLKLLDEDGEELTCEATVEHGTLRGLITGMNGNDAARPMIRAYVKVLKEYVQHHVKEEERELFPRVEKLDLDLEAMADQALALKEQLTEQAGDPSGIARGSTIRIVDVSARGAMH